MVAEGEHTASNAEIQCLIESVWTRGNKDEDSFHQQYHHHHVEPEPSFGSELSLTGDPEHQHSVLEGSTVLHPTMAVLSPHAEDISAPPSWPLLGVLGPCTPDGSLPARFASIDEVQQQSPMAVITQAEQPMVVSENSRGPPGGAQELFGTAKEIINPPDPGYRAEFSIGEKVLYWSKTHSTWMEASVTRLNLMDGVVASYDLDVKRAAQASRMKRLHATNEHEPLSRVTVPAPMPIGGCSTPVAADLPGPLSSISTSVFCMTSPSPSKPHMPVASTSVPQTAAEEVFDMMSPAPIGVNKGEDCISSAPLPRFEIGDRVLYWSDTHRLWMPATVQRVREGGTTYDLDVKRGAQAKKMKLAQGSSIQAVPMGQGSRGITSMRSHLPVTDGVHHGASLSVQLEKGMSGDSMPQPAGNVSLSVPAAGSSVQSRKVTSNMISDDVAAGAAKAKSAFTMSYHTGGDSGTHADSVVVGNKAVFSRAPAGTSPQNSGHIATGAGPVSIATTAGANARSEPPTPPGAVAHNAATTATGMSSLAQAMGSSSTAATNAIVMKSASGQVVSTSGKVMLKPSVPTTVESNGNAPVRPASPLFMGTGVERTSTNVGMTRHRVSLPSTAVSGSPTNRAAEQLVTHPSSCGGSRGLEVDELQFGSGPFNPTTDPALRSQLQAKLGLGSYCTFEEMQGFRGGLNEGVWFAKKGGKEELVLKLVRCHRVAQNVLTEAENFLKIYRQHPTIINDPTLAFPVKIFSCLGPGGTKRHDLIVMRKVRGERFAELIARKWYGGQKSQLLQILEKLGACLAEFHSRYGNSQHGDFQPSNIFYDEERGEVALIDVGGIGVPTTETDIEHITKSMKLLAETYGHQLATDGMRHFENGYKKRATNGYG